MIGYLDTSAFVPLLVEEPTSTACRRFWDDADTLVSTRLLHVETSAALALAQRIGRLGPGQLSRCRSVLEELWEAVEVLELDVELMRAASRHAGDHALRGDDALHCAAAWLVNDTDVVAATGDRQLLRSWSDLGVATYDTTG
ncbi:type II toxin-antitoxin system VapC family toxin [Georgenia muralis]